jgi:hypothetical protein
VRSRTSSRVAARSAADLSAMLSGGGMPPKPRQARAAAQAKHGFKVRRGRQPSVAGSCGNGVVAGRF